jgi:cytochrome o ubiquinol oxidase subunit 3
MNTAAHTEDKVVFGFWAYLMSDCVLFAGLFAVYAVLQGSTFGAPAVGDFASLPLVFAQTLLLLVSSFTAGLALLAARRGKKTLTLIALVGTLILGLAFLGMEVSEFSSLLAEHPEASYSASLSAFFVLVGTHGAHIAAGSLWMLVVLAHVLAKGLTAGVVRKIALVSLFWHFLDLIWIFIFTFVYLFGILAL